MDLILSNVPTEAEQEQEFTVHFYYECLGCSKDAKYYLRACFYEDGSSNYSGCIKNHQDSWVCGSQEVLNYKEISLDSEGIWEGDLKIKSEVTGNLFLKVKRYTQGGDGSKETNSEALLILDNFSLIISPSPQPSFIEQETSFPDNIFISEFMPNPEEGGEWVELYNSNPFEVSLSDWQLDDIEGGSVPQTFSAVIEGKSFKVIYFTSNKLNNGGDEARLLRPDGWVLDKASYNKSTKNISWSLQSNSWCETEPSLEKENNSCLSTEEEEDSSSPSPVSSVSGGDEEEEEGVLGESVEAKVYRTSFDFKQNQSSVAGQMEIDLATISGEVLGQEVEEEEELGKEDKSGSKHGFLWFILGGGVLMTAGSLPLISPYFKNLLKE